jgi:potassium efflux system protein
MPVAQRYATLPVPQLEQLLVSAPPSKATCKSPGRSQQPDHHRQTRPERAQAEISSSQTRIQQINNILKTGKDSGKTLSADQRNQLNAELASLNALIPLRRQELAGNSQLQDLGNSQHDLLVEKTARLEQEIQDLQTLINQKRLAQSQETVTQQSIEAQKAGGSSLLATESAANLKLSDYLLKSTDRLNEVTQQNLQTKQQLDTVTQSDSALDEQINVLKGSLLLSKILYKQKQALPRLKVDRDLADQIADIRLYQFEVNQQRELISNPAPMSTTCCQPAAGRSHPATAPDPAGTGDHPQRPAGAPEPRAERAAQRIDHPATEPEATAEHRAEPARDPR